jgi:O-antigen/teichoic acid export membrane protein
MASLAPPIARPSARLRLNPHPLLRDLFLTAGTELGILLASLLVISIFGRLLGAVALGQYLLLRRVLAWLQSGTQLGLGVALPRQVAHAVKGPEWHRPAYFVAGLSLVLGFALCVALVFRVDSPLFARMIFGRSEAAELMLPLVLLLIGQGAHVSVYGYYRGLLAMTRANALELWNLAIIPVATVAALHRTGSVPLVVSVMGALTLASSLVVALPVIIEFVCYHAPSLPRGATDLLRSGIRRLPADLRASAAKLPGFARELLLYGIPRIPGDFALAGLLALGAVLASHVMSIGMVAYLLLGISILSAVGTAAVPVGTLMLSKVSMMLVQERHDEVRLNLQHVLTAVMEISVFVSLQLAIFADVVLRFWLGQGFGAGSAVVRIIVLAIPFFVVYATLRSSIDAVTTIPYNARNCCVALCLFAPFALAGTRLLPAHLALAGTAAAMVLAFGLLAGLTFHSGRLLFHLAVSWRQSAKGLALAVLLAGVSLALRRLPSINREPLSVLAVCCVSASLFFFALKVVGSPWLTFLVQLAFSPQPPSSQAASHGLSIRKACDVSGSSCAPPCLDAAGASSVPRPEEG